MRSRRELRDLFENAPVGVHLQDRGGRILRANAAELAIFGHRRERYVGRPWREFHVDPSAADELLERLIAAAPGEPVANFEARMTCADGSVKWVRVNANVLWDGDEFVHVRAFTRDVTAVKEAEAALRASEERSRRLVEGARDYSIHAIDAQGRVTAWNAAARGLYGGQEPHGRGPPSARSFSPEDVAADLPGRVLRAAAEEGRFRHEAWRARKDGSRFLAEVVHTALRDSEGRLEGFSVLTRDATQRERLESLRRETADLVAANRSVVAASRHRAEVLRSLSEGLRAPARSLAGVVDRLEASGAAADLLAALRAGVGDLSRAVEGLEDLLSTPSAGVGSEPEPVDLLHQAAEARDLLRDAADARRVHVDLDVDPSLRGAGGIVADPALLRQVLFNLLSNAVRVSRERGKVALRLLPEGPDRFRVEVEDSGLGLSPDVARRAFGERVAADNVAGAESGL